MERLSIDLVHHSDLVTWPGPLHSPRLAIGHARTPAIRRASKRTKTDWSPIPSRYFSSHSTQGIFILDLNHNSFHHYHYYLHLHHHRRFRRAGSAYRNLRLATPLPSPRLPSICFIRNRTKTVYLTPPPFISSSIPAPSIAQGHDIINRSSHTVRVLYSFPCSAFS